MSAAAAEEPREPWFQLSGITKIYGSGASEVRALDGVDLRHLPG